MNLERIIKEIDNEIISLSAAISHMELRVTENRNNYRSRKSETKEVVRLENKIAVMKHEYDVLKCMLEAAKAAGSANKKDCR